MTTRSAIIELRDACRALLAATEKVMSTLPPDASAPHIEQIVTAVADRYGYTFGMMQGRDRTQRVSEARHVAIYFAREFTEATVASLGEIMKRDHGTICNSLSTMRDRLESDPTFARRVDKIRESISHLKEAA